MSVFVCLVFLFWISFATPFLAERSLVVFVLLEENHLYKLHLGFARSSAPQSHRPVLALFTKLYLKYVGVQQVDQLRHQDNIIVFLVDFFF